MSEIARAVAKSALSALSVCGLLAIAAPLIIPGEAKLDHKVLLYMFMAMTAGLAVYEFYFIKIHPAASNRRVSNS